VTAEYVAETSGLVVAPQVTFNDPDLSSPDFAQGTVNFALTANAESGDRLEVRNQGTAVGQIGVTGTSVLYGGQTIGSFIGGAGLTALVITLTSAADRNA